MNEIEHALLHELREWREQSKRQHKELMSNFTDLTDALSAVSDATTKGFTDLNTEIAAVVAALGTSSGTGATDAQLAAVTVKLNALGATISNGINAAIGQLVAAVAAIPTVPTAPVIVNQPQPPTIPAGGTETMTVSATGGGLAFQWFQGSAPDTSVPILGATNASFTTPPLTTTTSYWVRVTNALGSVDSSTVTVTVTA